MKGTRLGTRIIAYIAGFIVPMATYAQSSGSSGGPPVTPGEYFNRNSTDRFNIFTQQAGIAGSVQTPEVIIANIVRIIIGFIGMILVILLLYGGLTWMTSGGNEQKIEKAKETIKNAVIGLTITLTAYTIAYWVSRWLAGAIGS